MSAQTRLSSTKERSGGNDAVAFTSGAQGAPFSAGVVHAWLAADREKPIVATGISMGTIAAAAIRRVYQELEHVDGIDLEVKRWRWFQRYYQAVTENPLGPLWNAVPNPVDFVSETPPAKDPSVPDFLKQESERARRHYYLLTKLGIWLAHVPIRVSTAATLVVMYVRRKEGYGIFPLTWFTLQWNALLFVSGTFFHLLRRPQWIREFSFDTPSQWKLVRPLFGWTIYSAAVLTPVVASLFVWKVNHKLVNPIHSNFVRSSVIAAAMMVFFVIAVEIALRFLTSPRGPQKRSLITRLLIQLVSGNLDITKGLLHPYEIKRALYDLFVKDAPQYVLQEECKDTVKTLFVCAALQETNQLILADSMPIVDALAASVSIPGILPPQEVADHFVATQIESKATRLSVIDGAAVRTNPLPAFFNWCKHIAKPELSGRLECMDTKQRSLHVVYDVPIAYDGSAQDAPGMDCPDIVLSAQRAIQLAKRRDTRQEVRQTNSIARLEWQRRKLPCANYKNRVIFADEIAPLEEIDFGNSLSPDQKTLKKTVAAGCRATLETLYRGNLEALAANGTSVACAQLLIQIAPRRAEHIERTCGGLREVCSHCNGQLKYRPEPNPNRPQHGLLSTFGEPQTPTSARLQQLFPQLADLKQKVVFLGSGGVFRGAFHIGVLAALRQVKLYPDLVVGASVGTLMGGALCRMTASNEPDCAKTLAHLTKLFVRVDSRVSLTVTLKNAVKQMGIRARSVRLSPSELTRKIKKGSKTDAGFAATWSARLEMCQWIRENWTRRAYGTWQEVPA